MAKTIQQLTAALSPERHKRIGDRVVKIIADERSRRTRQLVRLVTQDAVKPPNIKRTPRRALAPSAKRKSQHKPGR